MYQVCLQMHRSWKSRGRRSLGFWPNSFKDGTWGCQKIQGVHFFRLFHVLFHFYVTIPPSPCVHLCVCYLQICNERSSISMRICFFVSVSMFVSPSLCASLSLNFSFCVSVSISLSISLYLYIVSPYIVIYSLTIFLYIVSLYVYLFSLSLFSMSLFLSYLSLSLTK